MNLNRSNFLKWYWKKKLGVLDFILTMQQSLGNEIRARLPKLFSFPNDNCIVKIESKKMFNLDEE